jgi:hypothetical protein
MMWAKQMRDGHAHEIMALKYQIEEDKEKSMKRKQEGQRLAGRVKAYLKQLEDAYECSM